MIIRTLDHKAVLDLIPKRRKQSHKGDYGKVLLLCGSRGYTGAAALAAMGALRTGSGLVFLGVPESVYPVLATKVTEPVVFPLPDEGGMLSCSACPLLLERLKSMDAVLIGPGIGQSQGTLAAVLTVLQNFEGTVVLDADGINVLAEHKDILRGRKAPTILTPHEGEYRRFAGAMCTNRMAAAKNMAKDLGVIVVLKGHRTLITDGTTCFVNCTGNPGMAVGGSGDVLAGIIVSLLGRGLDPLNAASCGAWLHGAAGDICAEIIGQNGMLPSDMLHVLPRLIK